jgi:hypothetical protein
MHLTPLPTIPLWSPLPRALTPLFRHAFIRLLECHASLSTPLPLYLPTSLTHPLAQ